MASSDQPRWPLSDLETLAVQVAEWFNAYVKAGIPPQHVAVMLGTFLATMGNAAQQGGDGT